MNITILNSKPLPHLLDKNISQFLDKLANIPYKIDVAQYKTDAKDGWQFLYIQLTDILREFPIIKVGKTVKNLLDFEKYDQTKDPYADK